MQSGTSATICEKARDAWSAARIIVRPGRLAGKQWQWLLLWNRSSDQSKRLGENLSAARRSIIPGCW